MRKECLDRSLGCDDALTAYGKTRCLSFARAICALTQLHFKHLQCLNFGFVYSSPWGSLSMRRLWSGPSTRERSEDQRCKQILMLSALRVAPDVHKEALTVTNPAHS